MNDSAIVPRQARLSHQLRSMEPERLSEELRNGDDAFLARRRRIIALSMTAAATMGLIALYQTGVIKSLPEPPLPYLDAERVNGSAEAYARFATPDAVLGLGSYAATLGLAAMGGSDRYRTMPLVPLAMAAKAAIDAAVAAKLTIDQWTKHRAFCIWCLTAAAATFAILHATIPEAAAALRELRGTTPGA